MYFVNEDKQLRFFRLRLAHSLIHNELLGNRSEKDNSEYLRKRKTSAIWRHHLPMYRNREGKNGILVKNEIPEIYLPQQ